jgi:hypothetical protein
MYGPTRISRQQAQAVAGQTVRFQRLAAVSGRGYGRLGRVVRLHWRGRAPGSRAPGLPAPQREAMTWASTTAPDASSSWWRRLVTLPVARRSGFRSWARGSAWAPNRVPNGCATRQTFRPGSVTTGCRIARAKRRPASTNGHQTPTLASTMSTYAKRARQTQQSLSTSDAYTLEYSAPDMWILPPVGLPSLLQCTSTRLGSNQTPSTYHTGPSRGVGLEIKCPGSRPAAA